MSQSIATLNRVYSTRSCRQQCFYGNAIAATENVLAAVSVDGHEVVQDFTFNHEDNSKLSGYKLLQQQIIGHNIQSVEDIEKWLRHTSEQILNSELNTKNVSQACLEKGLSEQLSEATDKQLLTDTELTPRKSNIDYNDILSDLHNNKILLESEKDDHILPDIHLHDLIVTHEVSSLCSELENSITDVNFENVTNKSHQNECNAMEGTVEPQHELQSMTKNQQSIDAKTDLINNVNKDSLDSNLTMSIQDLSIENDSSDGSSDSTNVENEPNKSENLNVPNVVQGQSTRYNKRNKSTKTPSVKSNLRQRKRKVNNEENTVENNSTESSDTSSDKEPLNENNKTFINKSPRSSTSESSGSDSDDLYKGRHPAFVTGQELIISKALDEAGVTEDSLEYYYNSNNIKTWHCHLGNCGRDFSKLSYLKIHLMTHLNVKPFKCDYSGCSWAFYTEFKLKRHKVTHLNKKDYVCSVAGCERKFTTSYNLAQHEKLHTRPNKNECQVPGCNAKFQTKRALENHVKTHDDGSAAYACNYEGCDKRFYSTNALMSHKRCHSYKEEDLTCSWPGCGKTFDLPCRKRTHMRSHTGQKPYACNVEGCDWVFSTSSKLKRHEKKHAKDGKYVCEEDGCSKAFSRVRHLKEHKLTHTEEKSFQCYHCDAGFETKNSLYVHIKNHINEICENNLQKKASVETKRTSNRKKKHSTGSSGSESTSNEETENIAVSSTFTEMPTANVLLQKMYKCPVESCSKWYSHRSSLRVHMFKHTKPLSEIQNGNGLNLEDSTTASLPISKSNEGAARTECTYEYILKLKPDRQVNVLNVLGADELSEGLLCNRVLPSVYCQDEVGLSEYQIFDTNPADFIQVLD